MQQTNKFFSYYISKTFSWFRIGSVVLSAKSLDHWPMSFSERYGYVKKAILFGWLFKVQKEA
jgi:hypothetical protein